MANHINDEKKETPLFESSFTMVARYITYNQINSSRDPKTYKAAALPQLHPGSLFLFFFEYNLETAEEREQFERAESQSFSL